VRKSRQIIFGALLVLAGAHAVARLQGPDGLADVFAKRREAQSLRKQIERKEADIEDMQGKIKGLDRKDRIDIEKRLLDEIPEHEIQFRVDEPKSAK
jgi:hypothetical protein